MELEDKKPWYLSKTIISGIVILILGLFGIKVEDSSMFQTIQDNYDNIATAVFGIIAIVSRFKATKQVTSPIKQLAPQPTIANYAPPQYAPPMNNYQQVPYQPPMQAPMAPSQYGAGSCIPPMPPSYYQPQPYAAPTQAPQG